MLLTTLNKDIDIHFHITIDISEAPLNNLASMGHLSLLEENTRLL